jgi:hypothetical protein
VLTGVCVCVWSQKVQNTKCTFLHLLKNNKKTGMELNERNRVIEELDSACRAGHPEHVTMLVTILLCSNVSLDTESVHGYFPLQRACSNGHLDVVKTLLRAGANKDSTDGAGHTPLQRACASGHIDVVEMLLRVGVDIEHRAGDGWTPLITSCKCGHWEIVKILLRAGAIHTGRMPVFRDRVDEIARAVSWEYKRDARLFALGIGDASCPMSLLAGFPHIAKFIVAVAAPPAVALKREPEIY